MTLVRAAGSGGDPVREKTEYEKMEREFLAPAIVRRARATARKKAWEADLKRTAEFPLRRRTR